MNFITRQSALMALDLGTRLFATYYICTAISIYALFGRLSSPNPKYRRFKLRDLDDAKELEKQQKEEERLQSSPERAKAGLKRKLSFLQSNSMDSNPFMNRTWEITVVERIKCALCGPLLLPPRIGFLLFCVLGAYTWGSLSSIGADLERPLASWRITLQKPMKLFARGILFSLGFLWVNEKGKKAESDEAPIVVANHIGFCEAMYLPGRLLSMAVSRRENAAIPVFGAMMQQVQCIFVSRTDRDSRVTVSKAIELRTKTERGQWKRPLLIFPEGTTTNGDAVISFKVGAFAPGVPVQPVSVRYGTRDVCDPSWLTGGPRPEEILLKLLCQPYNSMTIHFLPVYNPSPEEVADPVLYANNVRKVIAADLGVPTTDHSFEDVLMLMEARKLGYQGKLKEMIIELKSLRKILEIDLEKAKEHLKNFSSLDKDRDALLGYGDFIKVFGSKDTDELRTLFYMLDVRDRGAINLAEYTVGAALLNEQGTDKFDGAMKLAFKVYDSSGDGRLSKQDLARLLGKVSPLDTSAALVDETFASADVDKDGTLSSSEFLELARKNKEKWGPGKAGLFQ